MEVRGWGLLGSLLVTAGRSPPPLALRGAESPQPPALSGMAKAPCPPQSGLRSMTRSQGGTKTWHPHPESGMVCGAVPASRLLGFGPRPAWTPCHSSASPAAAPAPPSPAAGGNPGTGRPGTASETRPAPRTLAPRPLPLTPSSLSLELSVTSSGKPPGTSRPQSGSGRHWLPQTPTSSPRGSPQRLLTRGSLRLFGDCLSLCRPAVWFCSPRILSAFTSLACSGHQDISD